MRDSSYKIAVQNVIDPASLSADTTPVAIDLYAGDGATILIHVGAGGITFTTSNKIEFVLTHSDDNVTYTAVAAADVVLGANADASVGTGGIVKSLVAAHATADVTVVGYIGNKRYIKVLADFSGTHGSGTPLAVSVVQTYLAQTGKA
jgi:hypothetical protein